MQEEREAEEEKSNSEFKNPSSSSSSFLRTNGRTHSHTHAGAEGERERATAPFVQWKVKRHTFKLKHSTGDVDGKAAPPKPAARRARAETEEERGAAAETFVTHTDGGETLH